MNKENHYPDLMGGVKDIVNTAFIRELHKKSIRNRLKFWKNMCKCLRGFVEMNPKERNTCYLWQNRFNDWRSAYTEAMGKMEKLEIEMSQL